MFDIWGFLLQTLTASGVAVLLLIIKALLKDSELVILDLKFPDNDGYKR